MKHRTELEDVHSTRIKDISTQDEQHAKDLERVRVECEERSKARLLEVVEKKNQEILEVKNDWEHSEERHAEARKAFEEKLRALQNDLNSSDAVSGRAKSKKDAQLKAAQEKMDKIGAEAESLKVVLDLKSEELRSLRNENVRLEEKVEEFDRVSAELKKAAALVEDLKEQIASKNTLERKLSAENRKLSSAVEKESIEKKRLSMEKEELLWKMRQAEQTALSLSMIEGPTYTSSVTASKKLSCSFTEGTSASLPSSIVDQNPDSPRVLEVVKKTESVSWKLEYEQDQPLCSTPSPGIRRKNISTSSVPAFEPVEEEEHQQPPQQPPAAADDSINNADDFHISNLFEQEEC